MLLKRKKHDVMSCHDSYDLHFELKHIRQIFTFAAPKLNWLQLRFTRKRQPPLQSTITRYMNGALTCQTIMCDSKKHSDTWTRIYKRNCGCRMNKMKIFGLSVSSKGHKKAKLINVIIKTSRTECAVSLTQTWLKSTNSNFQHLWNH